MMSAEVEVRKVIERIGAAWRQKKFAEFDECFHIAIGARL